MDPSLPNLEISQVKNQTPKFLFQWSQLHKSDLSRLLIRVWKLWANKAQRWWFEKHYIKLKPWLVSMDLHCPVHPSLKNFSSSPSLLICQQSIKVVCAYMSVLVSWKQRNKRFSLPILGAQETPVAYKKSCKDVIFQLLQQTAFVKLKEFLENLLLYNFLTNIY